MSPKPGKKASVPAYALARAFLAQVLLHSMRTWLVVDMFSKTVANLTFLAFLLGLGAVAPLIPLAPGLGLAAQWMEG